MHDIERDKRTYKTLLELWKDENDDEKIKMVFNNITEKTVIFTEYVDTLKLLINKAEELKISFLAFDGQTSEKEFEKIEKEFDANLSLNKQKNDVRLLLCTDVLSEGVNLHRATKLIHFDNKWNPSKIIQREGRINRILNNNKRGQRITTASVVVPYQLENILSLEEKTAKKIKDADLLLNPDGKKKIKTFEYSFKPGHRYNNPDGRKFYYVFYSKDNGQIVFEKDYSKYGVELAPDPDISDYNAYEVRHMNTLSRVLFLSEGYKNNFISTDYVKAFEKHIETGLRITYNSLFYNVMYNKMFITIIQELYDNKKEINPALTFINDFVKNKKNNNEKFEFAEITAYE